MKHQAEGRRADIFWIRHGSRAVAVLLVAAALAWTVAACGSGAVKGPDDEASSNGGGENGGDNAGGDNGGGNGGSGNGGGDGGSGNGGSGNGGGDEFPWGLPPGDTSAAANEAIIYGQIEQGACEAAQTSLDEGWRGLNGPRAVLLYQAAIHFCRGERDAGRQLFVQTGDLFGWAGVNWPSLDCNVFIAIRSVLEQRAKEEIEDCPGGETPLWPEDDSRDDPRTPEDEGATPTPAEPSTTTTSTEPPTDSNTTTTESTEPSSNTDVGGSETTVGNGTDGDG
jgi:hypothetical protein